MDTGSRRTAELTDQLPSGFAVRVQTVAYSLLQIAVKKSLENLRVGAFAVIVTETVHRFSPLCYNFDVAIIARILYKCKGRKWYFFGNGEY